MSTARQVLTIFATGALCLAIVISSLMLQPSAQAQEKDVITWAKVNIPPVFILEGLHAGTGALDRLTDFMIEQLGQYDHRIEIFPNGSRLATLVEEGEHVCSAVFFYNPPDHIRRKTRSLSAPNSILFGRQLVVRKEDRPLYGDDVSFEEVFTNQSLMFGYGSGTVFAPPIQAIISRELGVTDLNMLTIQEQTMLYDQAPNIYCRSGADMEWGLYKMLASERVDYLLDSPMVVRFYDDSPDFHDKFATIPVKETPHIWRLAFGCPNTEWGNQVINNINRVLKTVRPSPEYRQMLEWFVSPKEQEDEYWKLYEEQLLTVFE